LFGATAIKCSNSGSVMLVIVRITVGDPNKHSMAPAVDECMFEAADSFNWTQFFGWLPELPGRFEPFDTPG
jgi:hypothetical protein